MHRIRSYLPLAFWFIVLVLLVRGGLAVAAVQRTFVASTGIDANPCSLTQPCRTFAAAIAKTNGGGEVIVLDSAGYGPVTIAQSVTISAPAGVYAGISVFSGAGVTVNGSAIDVRLQGLTINSQGGAEGIRFIHGTTLAIDRCRISGFANAGILQDATSGKMLVIGTSINGGAGDGIQTGATAVIDQVVIADVGGIAISVADGANAAVRASSISGTLSNGFLATSSVGATRLTIDTVSVVGCASGVAAFSNGGSTSVDVIRSRISGNAGDGVSSLALGGGFANIHVTDSLISNNSGAGLGTQETGEMTASGNTIVANGHFGFDNAGGMFTMNNNQVRDNSPANSNTAATVLGPN